MQTASAVPVSAAQAACTSPPETRVLRNKRNEGRSGRKRKRGGKLGRHLILLQKNLIPRCMKSYTFSGRLTLGSSLKVRFSIPTLWSWICHSRHTTELKSQAQLPVGDDPSVHHYKLQDNHSSRLRKIQCGSLQKTPKLTLTSQLDHLRLHQKKKSNKPLQNYDEETGEGGHRGRTERRNRKRRKKGMSKRDGSPKETQEKGWEERKGKEESWVGVRGCYAPEREGIGTPSQVLQGQHQSAPLTWLRYNCVHLRKSCTFYMLENDSIGIMRQPLWLCYGYQVSQEMWMPNRSWADGKHTAPIIHPYKEKAFCILPKFPMTEKEDRTTLLKRPGFTWLF